MDTIEKVLGQKVTFILVQRHKETGLEQGVYYNEYNGSLNPSYELSGATHFPDIETVESLAQVQNMMAKILKQKYEYVVVREDINRTEAVSETE